MIDHGQSNWILELIKALINRRVVVGSSWTAESRQMVSKENSLLQITRQDILNAIGQDTVAARNITTSGTALIERDGDIDFPSGKVRTGGVMADMNYISVNHGGKWYKGELSSNTDGTWSIISGIQITTNCRSKTGSVVIQDWVCADQTVNITAVYGPGSAQLIATIHFLGVVGGLFKWSFTGSFSANPLPDPPGGYGFASGSWVGGTATPDTNQPSNYPIGSFTLYATANISSPNGWHQQSYVEINCNFGRGTNLQINDFNPVPETEDQAIARAIATMSWDDPGLCDAYKVPRSPGDQTLYFRYGECQAVLSGLNVGQAYVLSFNIGEKPYGSYGPYAPSYSIVVPFTASDFTYTSAWQVITVSSGYDAAVLTVNVSLG